MNPGTDIAQSSEKKDENINKVDDTFETVLGGLTSAIGFTDERRANRSEGMKEDTSMHCLFHCC